MAEPITEQPERGGTRWYQRVLPVTGIVLAIGAVAALLVPAFREQVAMSTTRQDQSFVELYFPQTRDAARARCAKDADVRFVVVSHVDETRRLAYRVTVTRTGQDATERNGHVRLDPGQKRVVRTQVAGPGGGEVLVRLPGLDQVIRASCSGARP